MISHATFTVRGLLLILALMSSANPSTAAGPGAVSAGGGRSTGGVYVNLSTLGQLAGPPVGGGVYQLASGLQSRNAPPSEPPPGSEAPRISAIPDQVIDEDTEAGPIPVTISDPDTPLPQLTINPTSSNPLLVRPIDIAFGGTGSNRVMKIAPRTNQYGSTIITITATDPQNHSTSRSFLVEVLPVNDPPVIAPLADISLESGEQRIIGFNLSDVDDDPASLHVIALSDSPALIPPGGLALAGEGSQRQLGIAAASGQTGVARIGLQVTDPHRATASTSFRVWVVVPPRSCAFPPTLHALQLTNRLLELRWEACDTNYQYQIEHSRNFTDWRNAGPSYAAPPGGGWLTNIVTPTNRYIFFRVRADRLTNSPVPSTAGIYPKLFFTHDGLLRSYRLMIPTNYNAGVSNALALILHGHGQTAESFAAQHPALFFHAQTNNLILVLPDSTTDERNTGWNNRDPAPGQYQVNDVSYLLALIDRLDATLTLDRRRLYAGGFSSGGVMCHYLGARTTNIFAALAAIEASIGGDMGTGAIILNPPAAGPMPVLIMNCTNSCARPYYGGPNADGVIITAAIEAAYYWTNANLCAAAMTASTNNFVTNGMFRFEACDSKPPPAVLQPNQVILQRWGSCAPGAEVLFVTLTDGGHAWPDRGDNLGFDANADVLRFFLRHQR